MIQCSQKPLPGDRLPTNPRLGQKGGETMEEIYRLFVPSITEGMFKGFCLFIQAIATCAIHLFSRPDFIAALLIVCAYMFINDKLNKHNL